MCERLNSSYISIRASDWSCVEGNSKQSNNQKYPDRDSYTVITAEFVRLFLFISRGKAMVALRNVGISAKYVIKIHAFGSAHVKFGV